MDRIRSGDAEIAYVVLGDGPPLVLLHPFPAHHELWLPAAQALTSRYRLILPDLRGHGESDIGEGAAAMEKHAADLARVMDETDVGRAVFCGVSIGGYVLFEFWRRYRARVEGLVLCDTRSQGETPESRATRLKSAADVLEQGTEKFIDGMIPRVFGKTTLATRPDLIDGARRMMLKMSANDVAQVQRGMAERPDSTPTLKTIDVPTLILIGEEDALTTVADGESMRQNIPGSQFKVVAKAGHYAVWERSEEVGKVLRQFVDSLR
jgi:pimeloyl-ACP methyl ester carboxylesterase